MRYTSFSNSKIHLITGIILLLLSNSAVAQKNKDALYLKNGSIIRGTIILPADSTKIGIELKDHSFALYNNDEVEATKKGVYGAKSNGFSIKLNMCLYGGSQLSSGTKIQGGYKFKDKFYLGVGSGIEGFEQRYIPLFIETRFNISTRATLPYIFFYGGYNFYSGNRGNRSSTYYYDQWGNGYYVEGEYDGGPLCAVGIGMTRHFNSNIGLGFQLGYRYQRTYTTYPNLFWVTTGNWGAGYYDSNGTTLITSNFHRLELGVFLLL
ncbi:MAG: hypothetical protein JKY42_10010 [Flavobacteriales bacterium]|nr:hypothetical protein [Flavobacteriales bacterium]